MGVWRDRQLIYKLGFIGVLLGSLLYIVGFCAPSWAQFKTPNAHHEVQSLGLWQICSGSLAVCRMSVGSDDAGWLKAVRALTCISMFFAVAACIIGFYCNCILKAQFSSGIFSKNTETSAIISVVFGAFGLIIFATQVHNYYPKKVAHISWSFIVVCIAIACLGISAFLMFISHKIALLQEQGHYPHRDNFSFSHVRLDPDYPNFAGQRMFNPPLDGHVDFAPPPYDTIVNCIPQDEVAPPTYTEAVGQ